MMSMVLSHMKLFGTIKGALGGFKHDWGLEISTPLQSSD